jgi:hypothetical protein
VRPCSNVTHAELYDARPSPAQSGVGEVSASIALPPGSGKRAAPPEFRVGFDEELAEPIVLGELLASRADDPSMAGSRNVDWEEFLRSHDHRCRVIVKSIARGEKPAETAKALGISYSRFQWIRLCLEADLLEHMGEQILDESVQAPAWRGDLRVKSERTARLADRRRR